MSLKLRSYDFQPMESPADELAISMAMLSSLKSRGLLTAEQTRECAQILETLYCGSKSNKEKGGGQL